MKKFLDWLSSLIDLAFPKPPPIQPIEEEVTIIVIPKAYVLNKYEEEWKKIYRTPIKIKPEFLANAILAVDKIILNRAKCENVVKELKCPWYLAGILQIMEANGDFSKHIWNGDPLTARTVNYPPGMPKGSKPPFTWEYSAIQCLKQKCNYDMHDDPGIILYATEKFNGLGYRGKIYSPYVTSGSQFYTKGKYVRDHVWDPEAVSKQIGTALLLTLLESRKIITLV